MGDSLVFWSSTFFDVHHVDHHFCLSAEELGQRHPPQSSKESTTSQLPPLPSIVFSSHRPVTPWIDTNKQDACYSELAPASDQNPTSQRTGSQAWHVSASFSRTAFNGRLESHTWQFSEHLFIQTNADHLLPAVTWVVGEIWVRSLPVPAFQFRPFISVTTISLSSSHDMSELRLFL